MNQMLSLGVGGILGTFARAFLSTWMQRIWNTRFPIGTIFVNLIGCFLIGIFIALEEKGTINLEWRLFLIVGFCGAFTTFSTFIFETANLASKGQWAFALGNIFLSLFAGLLFFFLGAWATRTL